MTDMYAPDVDLLERWLKHFDIPYDHCGQCDALHLVSPRKLEGVVDSRLLVERYGLLLLTELEIRPMAVLPLVAELGRLNSDFPTLKVYLDIDDEASPLIEVLAVQLTGAGLSQEQFSTFITTTLEETAQLAEACLQLDYLFEEPSSKRDTTRHSLH